MSNVPLVSTRSRILACLLLGTAVASPALAQDGAEQLLPSTVAAYVTVSEPAELLTAFWNHPLRRRAEDIDSIKAGLESPDYLKFRAIVSAVEAELGVTWRQALQVSTARGIHLAVDTKTEGIVMLVGASDAAQRDSMLNRIIQLARNDARSKDNEDPYETQDYRGITAHQADDLVIAPLGTWLMVTNKSELAKTIADAFLDGSEAPLSKSELFQQASEQLRGAPVAWGYVDLKLMRDRGLAPEVFQGRTENVIAEMLLGGIQADLLVAPLLAIAVYAEHPQIRLELAMNHAHPKDGDLREYYFGQQGRGRAPPLLRADRRILSLSTYRDLSQMWLRAGDLMNSNAVDELAEADSGLTNLFAGKDFGEDILGAFDPRIQLVVRRQDFADRMPQPAVKLPSFALVFRLKDPVAMRPELRRTFQSLVGFLNVAGSSQGQPQLDQDMRTTGDLQLVMASYVPEADERDSKEARINFNFSPSIGFLGDRFILASTKELAIELAQPEATGSGNGAAEVVNSQIVADASIVSQLLRDNREQLVAQNMLEKGHGRDAAGKEIDGLFDIAELLENAALKLSVAEQKLRLVLSVDVDSNQ